MHNKGIGECMAQELTSPLHGWSYNDPITGEWSNHDYKCTMDRYPPHTQKWIKRIGNPSNLNYGFSTMIRTDKAWRVYQRNSVGAVHIESRSRPHFKYLVQMSSFLHNIYCRRWLRNSGEPCTNFSKVNECSALLFRLLLSKPYRF